MPIGPTFGRVEDADQLCRAVEQTLRTWLITYLAEVERQNNLAPRTLPQPKAYRTGVQLTATIGDNLPLIVVYCPGLAGDVRKLGNGTFEVPWAVSAGVLLAGQSIDDTHGRLRQYVAAIRACLLQKFDGAWVHWTDETYDDGPEVKGRSLAGGEVAFSMTVEDSVRDYRGPFVVPDDPYAPPGDWPVVLEADVDVELKEDE